MVSSVYKLRGSRAGRAAAVEAWRRRWVGRLATPSGGVHRAQQHPGAAAGGRWLWGSMEVMVDGGLLGVRVGCPMPQRR